jgi:hypothetical protein
MLACLTITLLAGPAGAQTDDGTGDARQPVGAQMRRLFAVRLKTDVGLDDAQVGAVLPRVESLERQRVRWLGERRVLLRELRRGLEAGMPDAELQRRLHALDRIGSESERETRETLAAIDRDLNVPQRVRLRFLLTRFRQEISHRVQEFRRDGAGDPGRHRGSRRSAPPPDPAP